MNSREFRKAMSFIAFGGDRFRLTTRFRADLNAAIGLGETLSPSDTLSIPTVDGSTPMTLAELYELRNAIARKSSDALRDIGA